MKHLSDSDIQEYLDSSGILDTDSIESHLIVCQDCREKVDRYKELYSQLEFEGDFDLGKNFNSKVLSRIRSLERKSVSTSFFYSMIAVFGIFASLFVLDWLNLISIQTIATAISENTSAWTKPTFEVLASLLASLNGNIEVLAFAAATTVLFQLLDKNIIQSKFKGF